MIDQFTGKSEHNAKQCCLLYLSDCCLYNHIDSVSLISRAEIEQAQREGILACGKISAGSEDPQTNVDHIKEVLGKYCPRVQRALQADEKTN